MVTGPTAAPTYDEVQNAIRTVARVRDEELALELAYVLVMSSRLGKRTSTIAHARPNWLKKDRKWLFIPDNEPCACGSCDSAARRIVERSKQKHANAEDPDWEPKTFKTVRNQYWRPKTTTTVGPVPLYHNEQIASIVQRYMDMVEARQASHSKQPPMSPTTVRRRAKLAAELTGLDVTTFSPRAGRAAAAMYWATILSLGNLQVLFGWKYPHTARYYIRMSGRTLARSIDRVFDSADNKPYPEEWFTNRPQWSEIRPDDPDGMIEVESVTPSVSVSSDPLRDDETDLTESKTLTEFAEELGVASPEEYRKEPDVDPASIFSDIQTDTEQTKLNEVFNDEQGMAEPLPIERAVGTAVGAVRSAVNRVAG